jgi:PKHD-type hydroxylase
VTTYNPGDHYTWHCDYGVSTGDSYTRKISMTLPISDPNDYEGGDLELIDYQGNILKAPKEKGTMIFFDSRIPHRVTPVIKGKRISLVAWMMGPKLR